MLLERLLSGGNGAASVSAGLLELPDDGAAQPLSASTLYLSPPDSEMQSNGALENARRCLPRMKHAFVSGGSHFDFVTREAGDLAAMIDSFFVLTERPVGDASAVQIFVRTLSGASIAIDVIREITVAQVRAIIETRTGEPAARLIFEGRQLEDTDSLASHGIEKESTIHVLPRMRAGARMLQQAAKTSDGEETSSSSSKGLLPLLCVQLRGVLAAPGLPTGIKVLLPFFAVAASLLYAMWILLYLILYLPMHLLRFVDRALLPHKIPDATASTWAMPLLVLAESPLAIVSYALYRTLRPIFIVLPHKLVADKLHAGGWVDSPGLMAAHGAWSSLIMQGLCYGPRWNTHTNVHTWYLGKLVPGELTIEIENVSQPGFSWQVVCYGNQKTLASQAAAPGGACEWLTMRVDGAQSTHVLLNVRLYIFDTCKEALLPRIKLNGHLLLDSSAGAAAFTRDKLAFNQELRARQQLHHLAMQFHVWTMLRAQRCLPAAMVREVYLPVGNPETQWLYGVVLEGYALELWVDASLLPDHLVFVTVYSRASIPTQASISVEATELTLQRALEDGFWAVRIVRKDGGRSDPGVRKMVTVGCVSAQDSRGGWVEIRDDAGNEP